MAKTKSRRYRRRSGRWAPNIVKISSTNQATTGEWFNAEELVTNPTNTSSGISQSFTVKNFEINFTIETEGLSSSNALESITAYIMFVPQGMTVSSSYYADHPEYILAYKFLGSPNSPYFTVTSSSTTKYERQQYQPYRIKTRMSRRLQTGDKIILYIQGSNQDVTQNYNIDGLVRWRKS